MFYQNYLKPDIKIINNNITLITILKEKTMKKIFSTILILSLILSSVPVFAFNDVSSKDWHYEYISKASEKALANGYIDGSFKPNKNIKVSEFVTMTVNVLEKKNIIKPSSVIIEKPIVKPIITSKLPAESILKNMGVDEILKKWYTSRVEIAIKEGLIKFGEFSEKDFERNITRAEMARIIARASDLLDPSNDPIDSSSTPFEDKISAEYNTYINKAYGKGLLSGYPDKTFRPDNQATRAEATIVVLRLYNLAK